MSRIPKVSVRKTRTTTPPVRGIILSAEDTITISISTDILGRELLLDRRGAIANAAARAIKMLHDQLELVEVREN